MFATLRALRPHPSRALAATRAFSSTPAARLAKTQLIGRLTAAPELITTTSGRALVQYSVAVNHNAPDPANRETSFFRIASFSEGPQREFLLGLVKGTLVHVDAEARMRAVPDAETGKNTPRLNLVQRSIDIISRPQNAAGAEA